MSLVQCRECQKEVSTQARSCPNCGGPYPSREEWKGSGFEWRSKSVIYGWPLVHIAFGRDVKGKLRIARGFIAIGQFAVGVITIAQFGIGFLFGFGQFMFGFIAIAQFAIAALFGLGQFATGYVAIGQFVLAYYGLAQIGFAKYIWTPKAGDQEAIEFFRQFLAKVKSFFITG